MKSNIKIGVLIIFALLASWFITAGWTWVVCQVFGLVFQWKYVLVAFLTLALLRSNLDLNLKS